MRLLYFIGVFIFLQSNVVLKIHKNIKEIDKEIKLSNKVANYDYLFDKFFDKIEFLKIDNKDCRFSKIEFAKEIYIAHEKEKAYYIDFVNSEGFMVISELKLYSFNFESDLKELRTIGDFEYSIADDFVYYNLKKHRYEKIYDETYENIICTSVAGTDEITYDGQLYPGDGYIYDLDKYIKDRYPSFNKMEMIYIKNYKWTNQFDTSVFLEKSYFEDGEVYRLYSEGNCVINSTYSMLSNLPLLSINDNYWEYNTNYISGIFPIDYSTAVYSDMQYPYYGMNNFGRTIYYEDLNQSLNTHWNINTSLNSENKQTIKNLPALYMQLRTIAINEGYKCEEGMLFSATEEMVEGVNAIYNYNVDFELTSSIEAVISNLKNGIPSLISTQNSDTYKNHSMVVYGYAKYSYIQIVGAISQVYNRYFFAVDSGHGPLNDYRFKDEEGNYLGWFDPYQSDSISFGLINRNSLIWPTC